MLSRVANSIYWMARYMERAGNLARLLSANQSLMLDAGAQQEGSDFWQPILMATGDEEGYDKIYPVREAGHISEFLALHPGNPNSFVNSIRAARENARMIRDQITDEMWSSVNDLYLFVTTGKGRQLYKVSPADYCEQIMQGSSLFQGAASSTMMRDVCWQFFQIGTYLERADKTSRLVDTCSGVPLVTPPHPEAQPLRWLSLLHSLSAYHGYREHDNQLNPRTVLEFLFLSDRFARSVRFCTRRVDQALRSLVSPLGAPKEFDPLRASGRLCASLDFGTIDEILEFDLHEYIDDLQTRLNTLGNAIYQTFVLYAERAPGVPPSSARNQFQGTGQSEQDTQIQQQQQ